MDKVNEKRVIIVGLILDWGGWNEDMSSGTDLDICSILHSSYVTYL